MPLIETGNVRSSFGLDGTFRVSSASGKTDHFRRLKRVALCGKDGKLTEYDVERCRISGKDIYVKLKNIDTPEAAKLLSGFSILVDEEDCAHKAPDEYYIKDLLSCAVISVSGEKLADVSSFSESGGKVLYLLCKDSGGKEKVLPFQEPFIGKVDISAGSIELAMPEIWE